MRIIFKICEIFFIELKKLKNYFFIYLVRLDLERKFINLESLTNKFQDKYFGYNDHKNFTSKFIQILVLLIFFGNGS